MPKIRVLHVHSDVCGGGVETFIATMARALVDQCDSSMFSLAAGRAYDGPDLPTDDGDHPRLDVATIFGHLLRHVRAWRPDVIHTHPTDAMRYGAAVQAFARRRPRLVVHWHNTHSTRSRTMLGRWVGRYALRRADVVLACSDAAAEYHKAFHSFSGEQVRVLHNPVDLSAYDSASEDHRIRQRAGAQDGEVLGVFLGRLSMEVKGLDILCEAVRLLRDDLPLKVALVGPGNLEAVTKELEPPDRVELTGPVDRGDVPGVLRSSDICLQPSRSEGFPLTVIEAMAAGLPVIASRVGGIPEAVEDGMTGILVPAEDPDALAEAIRWMVEHPEERQEMGRRGRKRAKLFDVGPIAAQLAEIYREVLDG